MIYCANQESQGWALALKYVAIMIMCETSTTRADDHEVEKLIQAAKKDDSKANGQSAMLPSQKQPESAVRKRRTFPSIASTPLEESCRY
jgi:hypothetical protein